MTKPVWDRIYKEFEKGGEAYATLSKKMDPSFIQLIKRINLPKKSALDIGFGTGRYIDVLRDLGFKVHGIDNSPTAYELASKELDTSDGLEVANMYEYKIPGNTYDFIYSISTIHHGTKPQVNKLLNDIYDALVVDGFVYLTFPALSTANGMATLDDKTEIAPGTFTPNSGPEKGLPHSIYTKEEIAETFDKYRVYSAEEDERGRWIVIAQK